MLLLASVAVAGVDAGLGAPVPSARVLDRTLDCPVGTSGGVYEISLRSYAGYKDGRTWGRLPFASVSTDGIQGFVNYLDGSLAWITAARPVHETDLVDPGDARLRTPVQSYGTLALNSRDCRPSRAKVPLTARGLVDVAPGPLGESRDCPAPRRVLVRVRAVAVAKPALYRDRHFTKTHTVLRESYLAVRTPGGRQLALAAAFENGKARLLTSATCTDS